MCTVMVIQQMSTNYVQTNDDFPYTLPHINLYLSFKESPHPDSFFLSLCIYGVFRFRKNSVFKDQKSVSKIYGKGRKKL